MFPIKDTIRSRSFPLVTWLIILLNGLVFYYELGLSPLGLERLFRTYGLVAERFALENPLTWLPLFTHMFLHGGWLHFLSNMWTLVIFGDNVEDRMGSLRFLIFYLLGGVAAGLMQVFLGGAAGVPSVGASGAIAAVLGAYFLFFPRAQVVTFIPVFILPWFINIPAVVYLGLWFVTQLYSGLLALALPVGMTMGGIAWWAHIGGFAFGLLLAFPFAAGRKPYRWQRDEYFPW